MKNIVIIGASGHAKVVIDIIEHKGTYNIVGLVDSYKDDTHTLFGYQVLGSENDLPDLIKKYDLYGGIIAIGDNFSRKYLYDKITFRLPHFNFLSAIHPNTIIGKNVTIEEGTVTLAGVIINSDAHIGKLCIINTNSSVGHESLLADFSSLAPGVTLGGSTKIGYCSAICLGANIIETIEIGAHTVIGAGALVNKPIGDHKIAYGVPARIIRTREENEPYLGGIYKYNLK
ncbi:acetyltransferase [Gaetbulibacter sp. M240]|uniref:acetyltransferase n=1 Tax=Gaetbulibacter sp. M240 TaxID=3126511 RepID=UPI00374E40EE